MSEAAPSAFAPTTKSAEAVALRPDWAPIIWFSVCHALGLVGPLFFFSWDAVIVAGVLYVVTGMLGITLGFHRLLSHRSLAVPRWLERTLAVCGSLALQKGPIDWVSHHRMHHAGVDTDRDPHDATRGFWWSHIGWMLFSNAKLNDPKLMRRFARDIVADPFMVRINHLGVHIGMQVALGALLLAVGGWSWLFWGVFTRLTVLYHGTWFVNSACHRWGYRRFESKDQSRNLWWVSLLVFGEGWHNNHHARQDAAPAGRSWWEIDPTWQTIKLLRALGLAWNVKDGDGVKSTEAGAR